MAVRGGEKGLVRTIHVEPQPEPARFDAKVRAKGRAFLTKQGITLGAAPPVGFQFEAYWRDCLDDLHRAYDGICAYLCEYFERGIGAGTVDHFVAKSTDRAELAYEWNNYRLACAAMNSRKHRYDDVLDPFDVRDGMFRIELVSGAIYPDRELSPSEHGQVQKTIDRLGLDDPLYREMRARHFQGYCQKEYTEAFLKRSSPFVWMEAKRHRLL